MNVHHFSLIGRATLCQPTGHMHVARWPRAGKRCCIGRGYMWSKWKCIPSTLWGIT